MSTIKMEIGINSVNYTFFNWTDISVTDRQHTIVRALNSHRRDSYLLEPIIE
jgi:hypothetical protein